MVLFGEGRRGGSSDDIGDVTRGELDAADQEVVDALAAIQGRSRERATASLIASSP